MQEKEVASLIESLAHELKVPVETIWNALVSGARFEILDPFLILFFIFFGTLGSVFFFKKRQATKGHDAIADDIRTGWTILIVFFVLFLFVMCILFVTELKEGMMGFLAPETIAVQRLLSKIGG